MDKVDFFNLPLLMENPIQEYTWGSKTAIQKIRRIEPDGKTPWAELWMGAHPKAPSAVRLNDVSMALNVLIQHYPDNILGVKTASEYNNALPYLLKVLAADQPLSIQAHPDAKQAGDGYERENRQQIHISASHRNYRDPWPKPELICAVEPFGALIGFRSPEAICSLARQFAPGGLAQLIRNLEARPEASGIRAFFNTLMTMEKPRQNEIINEALAAAGISETPEAYWMDRLSRAYPEDIGILAPIYLNLLEIAPGRAVYLPPGVMHAYLYGTGIEIMANSDNVLRGGLTAKHIDVKELIEVLDFQSTSPEVLSPQPAGDSEHQFLTPAKQFCLSVIDIKSGQIYAGQAGHSAEILFCLNGSARVRKTGTDIFMPLESGRSVLIASDAGAFEIIGSGRIFKAGVP